MVAFDTLAYVKTLRNAGFTEPQAEAQTVALTAAMSANELATKRDVEISKLELKQEISDCKQELKREISEVKQELKQEIAEVKQEISEVKQELRQEIAEVKQEINLLKKEVDRVESSLKKDIEHVESSLKKEMDGKFGLLYWMLGTLVGLMVICVLAVLGLVLRGGALVLTDTHYSVNPSKPETTMQAPSSDRGVSKMPESGDGKH